MVNPSLAGWVPVELPCIDPVPSTWLDCSKPVLTSSKAVLCGSEAVLTGLCVCAGSMAGQPVLIAVQGQLPANLKPVTYTMASPVSSGGQPSYQAVHVLQQIPTPASLGPALLAQNTVKSEPQENGEYTEVKGEDRGRGGGGVVVVW